MDRVAWSVVRAVMVIAVALQMVALIVLAAPAGDKITSLPGQPPVSFDQYSGYITVDESHGRRLFYYFVEAVNSSATAPLVLWLTGGPGCSSLMAAFSEQGPFRPNSSGTSLTLNDGAWNQVANVIFLESPAGVGFSYSNDTSDYSTDDEKTAQDSLVFLLGWLAEYPEYNSRDFYITGESYAGHFVPQLATAVLENNKLAGQAQINLKGVMIGNPLFDGAVIDVYSQYDYAWGHGMMSEDTHNTVVRECNYSNPSTACQQALSDADNEIGLNSPENSSFINAYDVLVDVCAVPSGPAQNFNKAWTVCHPWIFKIDLNSGEGRKLMRLTPGPHSSVYQVNRIAILTLMGVQTVFWPQKRRALQQTFDNTSWPPVDACIDNQVTEYLNLADVETSMHAEVTGWSLCNLSIHQNYAQENYSIPMAPLLANLVNSSVRVWVYSGDADIVIPLVGTRQIINTLAKSLNLKIKMKYQQWFEGCQIGGWSISWESLVYSTVRGAGHMVPTYQPARALQLFTSFLAGDDGPPTNTSSCGL